MPSLAGEHLQELESLVGPERQRQEEIIKGTLGSMYSGEAPYLMVHVHDSNKTSFSAGSDTVRVSRYSRILLTDSDIRDCVIDVLPLHGTCPFSARAKTSASGTRSCNWKRQATLIR